MRSVRCALCCALCALCARRDAAELRLSNVGKKQEQREAAKRMAKEKKEEEKRLAKRSKLEAELRKLQPGK